MIDTHIRPLVQESLIAPMAQAFANRQFNPNLLTFGALLSGLMIPFALFAGYPLIALACLGLTGYLDVMDGTVARLTNRDAPIGAVYDITSDRIVEFCIILGLYLVAPQERALLTILMLGSVLLCITTFLVVGIFSSGESEKSFCYSTGLMERTEAFLLFAAMIAFPSVFAPLASLFALLVTATGVIRVYQFSQQQ